MHEKFRYDALISDFGQNSLKQTVEDDGQRALESPCLTPESLWSPEAGNASTQRHLEISHTPAIHRVECIKKSTSKEQRDSS